MGEKTRIEIRPPTPEAKWHEHPELGIEAARTTMLVCECGWEVHVYDEKEADKTYHCCGRSEGVLESPIIQIDDTVHACLEHHRHGGPARVTRYVTTYASAGNSDCVGGRYR